MIFAVDVHYTGDESATAAGILFPKWESDDVDRLVVKDIQAVAPYVPGSFYKRELPCILSLLDEVDSALEAIVVDGYVTLGEEGRPGLGMHLYDALNQSVPVLGVAKNRFSGTPEECEVTRGSGKTPLFVTSAGLSLTQAKDRVRSMHGEHRLPTLLKRVDHACRGLPI